MGIDRLIVDGVEVGRSLLQASGVGVLSMDS